MSYHGRKTISLRFIQQIYNSDILLGVFSDNVLIASSQSDLLKKTRFPVLIDLAEERMVEEEKKLYNRSDTEERKIYIRVTEEKVKTDKEAHI